MDNKGLPVKEPYHLEKDLETKSVRAAFEGYEIRTPEIEALLNGKVLRVERPETHNASKNQFLDKFQKVESPAVSSGFTSAFSTREEQKAESGFKAPLQIEKPPGNTQPKGNFPTFKNRTGKIGEALNSNPDSEVRVGGTQKPSMDIDLLGGSTSFPSDRLAAPNHDIDFQTPEVSFAPPQIPKPTEGEYKTPKSKILSLKSRIDRPPQDEASKKTAYFGAQNQQKSNGYDDFFS